MGSFQGLDKYRIIADISYFIPARICTNIKIEGQYTNRSDPLTPQSTLTGFYPKAHGKNSRHQ